MIPIVVMGVSGSGKTTVGEMLAARFGAIFVDADDLHGEVNVAKMRAGTPLTDDDRWPWLRRVGEAIVAAGERGEGIVVACSALRRSYRDALRTTAGDVMFVELSGSAELLSQRIGARDGHFMPSTLLTSQLATLESLDTDERGVVVDVAGTPAQIAEEAAASLALAR